jgi:hypothetical protein
VRRARFALWVTTTALWGALACGGASSNQSAGADDETETEEGEGEDEGEGEKKSRKKMERPVSEHGKKWGGWRWKGKREDCFYVHKNQCHASLEEACRAAKCKKADCVHDDGAPAKVSCEK